MGDRIKVLDCTLRDGGLGLEDIFKNDSSEKGFSDETIDSLRCNLTRSKIDIIELGSIEITSDDRSRFAIYPDIQTISKKKPLKSTSEQLFAALYRGPDTPLNDIPNWNASLCEAVRVIIRYSELQKSLDFCAGLSKKGYKVFVQPMLTMRYTDEEIDLLIDSANSMSAYALYFVDSYGYMTTKDILRLYNHYDSGLNKEVKIGFHAHNNMNLAFSNVIDFLENSEERDVIVDSCILGMGQGAGNLQTEIIVPYLNKEYGKDYAYDSILNACEEIERYSPPGKWGYSVTRLLPALHNSAYKYSLAFRNTYGMNYVDINNVFKDMPADLRHRYTPENAELVLKGAGMDFDE